jgi:hypothetical protein
MLCRVALVWTDVSEELTASITRVQALSSSETLVHTRDTRRNIPEDVILHSHRRENIKSYETFLYLQLPFKLLVLSDLSWKSARFVFMELMVHVERSISIAISDGQYDVQFHVDFMNAGCIPLAFPYLG